MVHLTNRNNYHIILDEVKYCATLKYLDEETTNIFADILK